MKKINAIMMILSIIAGLRSESQENKPDSIRKKQKYCSAKITLLDKSVEKYALGGFADDSIIVFPIQIINNDPHILVEKETRIAATSIKKISIRIEKVKHSPDIYSNDSANKKEVNDAIAKKFKKNRTNEVIGGTGDLLLESGGDPLGLAVVGVFMLPILIPASILIGQVKVYPINGKPEKLDRMEKALTSRKH